MSRPKRKGLTPGQYKRIPPGPPVGCDYRVPKGHPCSGCPMYTNPCVYPCSRCKPKPIMSVLPSNKANSVSGGKRV